MIDPQLLRRDPHDVARTLLQTRGFVLDPGPFEALEAQRRALQARVEALQAERNQRAKAFAQAKRAGTPTEGLSLSEAEEAELANAGPELDRLRDAQAALAMAVPNLPHPSVPDGQDEAHNVELRRWGTPPTLVAPVLDHVDLGARLQRQLDPEAGADLAGTRFTVLRGGIARLHRALTQFMLNAHLDAGYEEAYVPYLVHPKALEGTGQLPKFKDDLFGVSRGDHPAVAVWAMQQPDGSLRPYTAEWFLIPTAEVPLTNLLRERVTPYAGPVKFVAHTPCFRAEAGSHGRDVRGMIRQHQFDKVELVWFVAPDEADAAFDRLVGDAEGILQALELPYRAVRLCAGDLGFSAARTIDLEVWIPSQNTYREISSCSHFGDFQARRLQARFKTAGGKPQLWHTLNGSALAVGRTLVAVLENYQQPNGDVIVPHVLRPYMGGVERLTVQG